MTRKRDVVSIETMGKRRTGFHFGNPGNAMRTMRPKEAQCS